jgi:hypothetical protein
MPPNGGMRVNGAMHRPGSLCTDLYVRPLHGGSEFIVYLGWQHRPHARHDLRAEICLSTRPLWPGQSP